MKTSFLLAFVTIACLACSGRDAPSVGMRDNGSGATASAAHEVEQPGFDLIARRVKASGSFANLPDRGELVSYPDRDTAKREGAYTWHQVGISEEHALRAIAGGTLHLSTPSGETLEIAYDHAVEHPSGDWSWVGHLRTDPGAQTILTFGAEAVFGSIGQAGKRSLRLTSHDGAAWLVETDPTKLVGLASAGANPRKADHLAVPKQMLDARARTTSAPQSTVAASATAAAATTIDVAVGYSGGMVSRLGSASAVLTRINNLVAATNEGYANSQVNARIRLVRAQQVSYSDASTNESALEQLTGYDTSSQQFTTPNAAFNGLRSARNQYGADLVVLLRAFLDPQQDGCGIAWLIGGGKSPATPGDGSDYFGYSVVSDGQDLNEDDGETYFCREESFAHELAHNMGSAHDRATAMGDDGVLDDPEDYGAYAYSFGYKTGAAAGNFYTIMAYGDQGQQDYRVFSNPRVTIPCGGRACGTANDDNARSLGATMPVIAQFRPSAVVEVPEQDLAPGITSSDINGDGRDDLFFRNGTQFVYWLMNGATRLGSKGYTVASDTRLAGYGDLDGNGRADLIWIRPTREVYIWMGSGTAFTSRLSHVHGQGWSLAGVADMNRDGRDDLLWYNPTTHYLSVWYMSGRTRTSSRSHSVPAGYRYVGSGDFNGDGRGDIVWDTASRNLHIWTNTGASFTRTFVRTYQSGWEVIGTRDINRNGRSDLQWRNQSSGSFVYWLMSGPTVASTRSFFVSTGLQSPGTGDFNGDGYGDVLWRNNSRQLYMYLGNGSVFTNRYVAQNGVGWSVAN